MAYFDKVPVVLQMALNKSRHDYYLLLDIDTPWIADNLRDKPYHGKEMFDRFETALIDFELPYTKISGLGDLRLTNAIARIEQLL